MVVGGAGARDQPVIRNARTIILCAPKVNVFTLYPQITQIGENHLCNLWMKKAIWESGLASVSGLRSPLQTCGPSTSPCCPVVSERRRFYLPPLVCSVSLSELRCPLREQCFRRSEHL